MKSPTTPGVVGGSIPRVISLSGDSPVRIAKNTARRRLYIVNESTSYKARFSVGNASDASLTHGVPIFPSGFLECEVNDEDTSVCRDTAASTAVATVTLWVYEEFDR